jgi:MFS transporter, DHA1 family, tetracycline resistance protein
MSDPSSVPVEATPPNPVPVAPASRHAVTFVFVTVLLDMIGVGIIIPVLPLLIGSVGHVNLASAAGIGGWMAAAYSIAQFLFAPLMGNLSDRFGRRPLLLLAIFGLGFDFLVQALAPTLGWLFLGRVLSGVCGASWVIANAYIADVTAPEDRARAFGMMGAAFGLGFIAGPAIGGLLGMFGPRVPFYAAAVVSALNFAYGWFVLPEALRAEHRRPFDWRRANPFGAFKVFSTYPSVLPMCAVLALFFFFTSVYPAIWPFWAKARFGWTEIYIGATLAGFGLVMALFQGGLSGPVTKRFGERQVIIVGLCSAALASFGYGIVWNLPMVIILMFVHGPEGFIHPMMTALMSKAVPENAQGELQGGLSAIMNIAMLLGQVFYAQLFRYFLTESAPFQSPNVAFFVASAGVVASLALFVYLVPRLRAAAA